MKAKTIFLIETGVAVVAVSLALAVTTMRAATGDTKAPAAATQETASPAPPPVPAGEPAETPPIVPALVPPPLAVSPGMDEIFQLARSGVTEDVLVAFIEKSGKAYHPSADEIIYLKDLGVAPAAIAKIIRTGNRDSELAKQVEAGQFEGLKPGQTAGLASEAASSVEPLDVAGPSTVNVNTQVYAAAPQPLEASGATTDIPAGPATNVDLNYFKTSLSPYGNWVFIEGYGECWQPTVGMVSSDWRPYFDGGRWVYTNSGWYWLSDYTWGWAPFHYGRWANHGRWGWVWVPSYTWGPAWVEWRTTSAHCGWAPLPPFYGSGFGWSTWGGSWGFSVGWSSFCWVPFRHCNGFYPRHHAVHRGAGREHYNNSTVVRPTININGNNNTVIVTGPDATVVANASRREIRRVDIRDVGGSESRGPREYLENGGKTLAAYRPTVRPDRNRPEVALANQRAEFRRPAAITPTTAGSSAMAVTAAEAANPRNIIVRGGADAARSAGSASAWRTATTSRSVESLTTRTAGQNTTINARPEYRRPATEPTTIGRSALVTRPAPLGNTAIGGGTRSEPSRTTSTWTPNTTRSLNSVPRQSVTAPNRTFQSPTAVDAPTITPSRRPTADDNRGTTTPSNFRSETPRNNSRPVIAPSVAPSRSEAPAMRTPAMAPPTIAPSSRPSYSPPVSSPSISRPAAPAPSRSAPASPPASSVAPSRSSSTPSNSDGGGGGGSRSGGPRRQD